MLITKYKKSKELKNGITISLSINVTGNKDYVQSDDIKTAILETKRLLEDGVADVVTEQLDKYQTILLRKVHRLKRKE